MPRRAECRTAICSRSTSDRCRNHRPIASPRAVKPRMMAKMIDPSAQLPKLKNRGVLLTEARRASVAGTEARRLRDLSQLADEGSGWNWR